MPLLQLLLLLSLRCTGPISVRIGVRVRGRAGVAVRVMGRVSVRVEARVRVNRRYDI